MKIRTFLIDGKEYVITKKTLEKDVQQRVNVDATIDLNSRYINNYFHFWFDSIDKYCQMNCKYSLSHELLPWQREILDTLKINVKDSTNGMKIIDNTSTDNTIFSSRVLSTMNDFLLHSPCPDSCRAKTASHPIIYIRRYGDIQRSVTNDREIVEKLTELGVHCLDLNNLTVHEQAHYFSIAQAVIGPHGAGFTNIGFIPNMSTIPIIEFLHYSYWHHDWCFAYISQLKGLRHYYCSANFTGENPHKGFMTIDIHLIVRIVRSILKNNDRLSGFGKSGHLPKACNDMSICDKK